MKYRKRRTIEAIRWSGSNELEIFNFLEGAKAQSHRDIKTEGKNFRIDFANGECAQGNLMIKDFFGEEQLASIGDYIVEDVGEFYPCSPKVFKLLYVLAEELHLNSEVLQDH